MDRSETVLNENLIFHNNCSDKSKEEKKIIVEKLHRQFSHSLYERLKELMKDA